MAMSVLDSAIANVALPTIAADLHADPVAATWVVTAYQLAIIMILLPVSALGERLGYTQVYLAGLALFVAMSLACAMAPGLPALATFRFLQGLGAAAMMGLNGALMRFVWPPALLGRGIGYNALVIAVTAATSPALAALILSLASWHWLFLVNIPAGLLSLALGLRFLPCPASTERFFDWQSALLNMVAFGTIFIALSRVGNEVTAPLLAAGLGAGAVMLHRARNDTRPMIPLDLMRISSLRQAYMASICAFAAQMCLLVSFPFLLVAQMGMKAAGIGLLVLPMPLGVALASPLAGRLAQARLGHVISACGLALFALTLILLAAAFPHRASPPEIAIAISLCGIGFGLFQTPNNHIMLRTGPISRAGAAAGMLTLSRIVGQGAGALVVAAALRACGAVTILPLSVASILAICASYLSRKRNIQ